MIVLSVPLLSVLIVTPAASQDTGPAAGRDSRLSIDVRAGYANATGDLGDLSDEGFLGGVGISYRITPRLALRSDWSVNRLRRAGRPRDLGGILGPKTQIWHGLAGLELELAGEHAMPWSVRAALGGGISLLDVSGTLDGGSAVPDSEEWKPTVGLSLMVGYGLASTVEIFARSEVYLMLGDRTSPGEYLGKEAVMGGSLGVRLFLS